MSSNVSTFDEYNPDAHEMCLSVPSNCTTATAVNITQTRTPAAALISPTSIPAAGISAVDAAIRIMLATPALTLSAPPTTPTIFFAKRIPFIITDTFDANATIDVITFSAAQSYLLLSLLLLAAPAPY